MIELFARMMPSQSGEHTFSRSRSGSARSSKSVTFDLEHAKVILPTSANIGQSRSVSLPPSSLTVDLSNVHFQPAVSLGFDAATNSYIVPRSIAMETVQFGPPTSVSFASPGSGPFSKYNVSRMESIPYGPATSLQLGNYYSDHGMDSVHYGAPLSVQYDHQMSSMPFRHFCGSPINSHPGTPEPMLSPSKSSRLVPSSLGYEIGPQGAYRQYALSPLTVEMEKFFSYPTMSVTFMPCVCVPDYPVEEGKPRKICRRCSVVSKDSR